MGKSLRRKIMKTIFISILAMSYFGAFAGEIAETTIEYKTQHWACADGFTEGIKIGNRRNDQPNTLTCLRTSSLGDMYKTSDYKCADGYTKGVTQGRLKNSKSFSVTKCLKISKLGKKYKTSNFKCEEGYSEGKKKSRKNHAFVMDCHILE